MRVVVVGSGIAGLSAAYHIAKYGSCESVTLLEADERLGGHSLTIEHDGQLIDLGFQVFNNETYPTLISLYKELGVVPVPSDMSFATATPTGRCIKFSAELGPYLSWLARSPLQFWDFVAAKLRFHAHAAEAMARPHAYPKQLGPFFEGYPAVFFENWIMPFTCAVWSLEAKDVAQFDTQAFLRFMHNHGFLTFSTHEWMTLPGGAREEVQAFERYFALNKVRTQTNTRVVAWDPSAKQLLMADGHTMEADRVVLAVAAPHARAILGASCPVQLAAFETTRSKVLLHRDRSWMPKERSAWASWNVVDGIVTYWLKSIQSCRIADENLFVTVVPVRITLGRSPSEIVWQGEMEHPKMQAGTKELQAQLLGGLWADGSVALCGAWLQYGFHEDGALTGAQAARRVLGDVLVPVMRPSNTLQQRAHPIWVAAEANVEHRSLQASQHAFAYSLPEVAVVDLAAMPSYWWGGCFAEDHWGGGAPLLHAIPRLIAQHLGFYPIGPICLVTTLRAFGQVMNPISVYVAWSPESGQPEAVVLEVHNYPWGEVQPYVIDGRNGQLNSQRQYTINTVFAKQLHVSPFHPHPAMTTQTYRASLIITRAEDERPFERLALSLDLLAGDSLIFTSTLTVAALERRLPRPLPVGLLTSFRILSQAYALSNSPRVGPLCCSPTHLP
jgi:predicted NAD/FAD-binding protein/DUF1365 family protein